MSTQRWPYVLGATGLVTGVPACLVTFLAPSRSLPEVLAGVAIAVVASMLAAKLGAALWMRHPLARDVLFADLMVWEWARRLRVERRLTTLQRVLGRDHVTPQARAEALGDLARLLEARDAYTHGHSRRVARHALRIAQTLQVPAAEARTIWTAATLHDVGKRYTPRQILNKPGRLTDDEFDVVRRHPVDGAHMLAEVEGDPELVGIVRSHHERLDGAGYPDGLAGADIPLGARIIAVADTFDALTSTRSYRPAATHKQALDILRKESGTQLDGPAVAAFLSTYAGRRPAALSSVVAVLPQRLIAWLGHEATAVASLAPAAGWVAPTLVAAATAFGAPLHAADRPATRAAAEPTAIAAARVARPGSAVAPAPAATAPNRAPPAGVRQLHPTAKRQTASAPTPAAAGTTTEQPAPAPPLAGPSAAPPPAASQPSTATTVGDVAATVKTPPRAAPAAPLPVHPPPVALPAVAHTVTLPVHLPPVALPAVTHTVTTTVDEVAAIVHRVVPVHPAP